MAGDRQTRQTQDRMPRKQSEESNEKRRRPLVGRPLSEETKAKMRLAHLGKPKSEEAKAKMRLAQQERRINSKQNEIMAATGCTKEQYKRAFYRWRGNKLNGDHGFTLEQEITRSMETDNGTLIAGVTWKKKIEAVQMDGDVPVPCEQRSAPEASAVPMPFDECWTDYPVDDAWVDQLD